MPLVTWFSQPQPPPPENPKNFSFYYMYETGTKQFCRIRLELDRNIPDAPTDNQTIISYDPNRVVGFAENGLPSPSENGKWSVNRELQLCYEGKPLEGPPPKSGVGIYDAQYAGVRSVTGFHVGNPVTTDPKLPPGIAAKHLALLAQEAMLDRTELTLTAGTATPQELAKAIQDRVVTILEVKNFDQVNDDLIKAKLIDQAEQMSLGVGTSARKDVTDALKAVQTLSSEINEQLTSGTTPNAEFETAFSEMRLAVGNAAIASTSGGGNVKEALNQITKAQQALETALKNVGTGESAVTQLTDAEESLSQAAVGARNWQSAETGYEPLTTADSVDRYMSTLSA